MSSLSLETNRRLSKTNDDRSFVAYMRNLKTRQSMIFFDGAISVCINPLPPKPHGHIASNIQCQQRPIACLRPRPDDQD